jgi:ABC-type Zn uptake system ZnuABC Zn-binding protein ZnuA
VDNITAALTDADPESGEYYRTNATAYQEELLALDTWITDQLDRIPEQDRKLVTDHDSLGYFARAYRMEQIGAVVPALTTEAETSGMQLADLINTIQQYHVKAIFVGVDFDPTLAKRVSEETGVDLVPLYFGSLTDGEPAGTYLDFMRYNVQRIVEALD